MESCFERALAAQCAPTLAGLKPGSLFRIGGDPATVRHTVDLWDRRLSPRGIRVRILKECPAAQACMIYLYRSSWMDRILEQPAIQEFLHRMGYQPGTTSSLLEQLSRRFCLEQESFWGIPWKTFWVLWSTGGGILPAAVFGSAMATPVPPRPALPDTGLVPPHISGCMNAAFL